MFSSTLPAHCEPTSAFLASWSATFGVCIPSELALLSTVLGCLSIVSWLFAQLPQIWRNHSLASTAGLSIWFLAEWCAGDVGNLLGALFTGQARWQVVVAGYYCFVDAVLVLQWVWYTKLRHGWIIKSYRVKSWDEGSDDSGSTRLLAGDDQSVSDTASVRSVATTASKSAARDITSTPGRLAANERTLGSPQEKLGSTPRRMVRMPGASSSPLASPRAVILIACLIAVCQASPISPHHELHGVHGLKAPLMMTRKAGPVDIAGIVLSWMSTALYLISRLPQLYKNYKRQSTSGLSPLLFMAAFFGNLFYSSSILTNPFVWNNFGPYGGGGWAGAEGSTRSAFIFRALPFFLGAAGVLILDGLVGVQFLMYGEASSVVVVEEIDAKGKRRRWKQVSGWMRGWIPSFGDAKKRSSRRERRSYGTI